MAHGVPIIAQYASGINAKVTGNTTIFTTDDSGLTFYPLEFYGHGENVSGVTVEPNVSFGTNSPNFDNLLNARTPTLITDDVKDFLNINFDKVISVPPSTAVVCRVNTAATATTYTFGVTLLGFYY